MVEAAPAIWPKAAARARRCVVLTGAGISAESGLATFRGPGGWWRNHDPQTLATPQAFRKNPGLVWEWYQWRREQAKRAEPSSGHRAIVVLEDIFPEFLLITQNVDGLHQRAGSRRMVEIHGNIFREKCFDCGQSGPGCSETKSPPRCSCGGLMRPDVVWFGEALPAEALETAWRESARAEIFLAVGTSGLVQPAASLPLAAKQGGAFLVEINPEPTPLSNWADLSIRAKAGEAMAVLVDALRAQGR